MDLNDITKSAIDKIIADRLPTMVESSVDKMVTKVIEDIFSSYGDVAKGIKQKIESSIDVNLQRFDLIDYNHLIADTINKNLVSQINLEPIMRMTKKVIGFIDKKEISLAEIAEKFIDASMEDNETDGDGSITFLVLENTERNWIEVYADIDPDLDRDRYSIHFVFNDTGIFSFTNKSKYSDSRLRPVTPARMISLSGLEAEIFRLYSARVKITHDGGDISNYWDRY